MSEKKYEFTDETIEVDGYILHRIRALRDFGSVHAGDLGGFIESEDNLSHDGTCWVHFGAWVYGIPAQLPVDHLVYIGCARPSGDEQVYIYLPQISGDEQVYIGFAQIYGVAKVYSGGAKTDIAEI